ncbi:helix-turn-helix transcriptional regulator [Mucilaginibacter sp. PAMB04168]|uniref:AraC family transcriptional regulator n=1 Tax=Mucilaginibacter sp. PAMB04168 TaxID=3138567 RepID=UPI0031F6CE72
MYASAQETVIPKYPFEPDEATGNPMFRVQQYNCVVNYKQSDFLIPHRKDYYFLALVKRGSSRGWVDTVPYVLKPNSFYFTVPRQVLLKEDISELTSISISFTDEFLALDESGSLKNLPIIQNPDNGHELVLSDADLIFVEDLLEKIQAEYEAKNNWQHNMLLAYTKVLLIYLSRLYQQQISAVAPQPNRVLLKSYLSKIDEWYTQLHEVTAYADIMNISAGHLSEVVKEQSGKPAIVHIHERLIVEAKRLLFHTNQSIKEIAFALGFEDASYFNRFFKRLTDYTPVSYRTTIREMYH